MLEIIRSQNYFYELIAMSGKPDEELMKALEQYRGKNKMKMRCGLALCVMLAMALGRIKENQAEKMRSLVASGAA